MALLTLSLWSSLWLKRHAWLLCFSGTELCSQGNPDLVYSAKGLLAVTGRDLPAFLWVCSLCYQPREFSYLGRHIPSSLKSMAVLWILSCNLTCFQKKKKKTARHIAFITEQRQNGREQVWVRNLRVMMWLRDYNILWVGGRLGSYENHLAFLSVFGKSLDRCLFVISLFPRNPNSKDTWFSSAWKTQN